MSKFWLKTVEMPAQLEPFKPIISPPYQYPKPRFRIPPYPSLFMLQHLLFSNNHSQRRHQLRIKIQKRKKTDLFFICIGNITKFQCFFQRVSSQSEQMLTPGLRTVKTLLSLRLVFKVSSPVVGLTILAATGFCLS